MEKISESKKGILWIFMEKFRKISVLFLYGKYWKLRTPNFLFLKFTEAAKSQIFSS
jgi:hypothetical protein